MANLLVVDDDSDVAMPLIMLLSMEGHVVQFAKNGAEGIAAIEAKKPDLILLDVEMPVLSGPQMANQLLILNCGKENIPIVLLSGVPDLHRIASQVGTTYFLTKPYGLDKLLALVSKALIERKPPMPEAV